jgi:Flp pilus assembly protein TadD
MFRVLVSCLLLAGSLAAQFDQTSTSVVQHLTVHVGFTAGGVCDSSIRVKLTSLSGPVDQGVPDERCVVEFSNVPMGNYRVTVTGMGFSTVDTNVVADLPEPQVVEVKITRSDGFDGRVASSSSPFAALADLRVPTSARKQYEKAKQSAAKKDWAKAMEKLNSAIAIYPNYAAAYGELGVVYSHLDEAGRAKDSLLKAISIDDHFAPAYINLGKMSINAGDFPAAESALTKASALAPTETEVLVFLAYAEFKNRHFDEAVLTSQKVHSRPDSPHAFAHWVAARALEEQHHTNEACAELRLFLNEEPTGPRAEAARKELAGLQHTWR